MIKTSFFYLRAFFTGKIPHFFQPGFHKVFLGKYHLRKKDSRSAYEYYAEQAKAYPRNAKIHYRLAKLSYDSGRFDESYALFKELATRYPYSDRFVVGFISMLIDNEKLEDAADVIRQTVGNRFCPQKLLDRLWPRLDSIKNLNMAESLLREALAIHPTQIKCKLSLASILFKLARHEEATRMLTEILASSSSPATQPVYIAIIDLLYRYKYLEKAEEVCFAALRRNMGHYKLHLYLGWINENRNNWNEAKKHFLLAFSNPSIEWDVEHFKCFDLFIRHNDVDCLSSVKYGDRIAKYVITHRISNIDALYGDIPGYDYNRYEKNIAMGWGTLVLANHAIRCSDFHSPDANIIHNERKVLNAPDEFHKSVHFFGVSQLLSSDLDDSHTMGSLLQRRLGAKERVFTHAVPGGNSRNMLLQLSVIDLKPNDAVVVVYPSRIINNVPVDDVRYDFMAMNKRCTDKGVNFHVFFLPSVCHVSLPSERERMMQELDCQRADDIVRNRKHGVSLCNALRQSGIHCAFLDSLTQRPHDLGEIFTDFFHFNHRLNQKITDTIFHEISNRQTIAIPDNLPNISLDESQKKAVLFLREKANDIYASNRSITDWLETVRKKSVSERARVGALVMNCNPFTKGHLHLVRTAFERMDSVYLFVVQENLSFFPFEDRMEMIRRNVKDFGENLHIVPSGQFIISSFSFPGYFTKETNFRNIDSTADIAIFGAVIAPSLNITHRFVGEEPTCMVTNAYNNTMLALLPPMGVEMHVIPRMKQSDSVISASQVRAAMQAGDKALLEQLLPCPTYEYLIEKKYI